MRCVPVVDSTGSGLSEARAMRDVARCTLNHPTSHGSLCPRPAHYRTVRSFATGRDHFAERTFIADLSPTTTEQSLWGCRHLFHSSGWPHRYSSVADQGEYGFVFRNETTKPIGKASLPRDLFIPLKGIHRAARRTQSTGLAPQSRTVGVYGALLFL